MLFFVFGSGGFGLVMVLSKLGSVRARFIYVIVFVFPDGGLFCYSSPGGRIAVYRVAPGVFS